MSRWELVAYASLEILLIAGAVAAYSINGKISHSDSPPPYDHSDIPIVDAQELKGIREETNARRASWKESKILPGEYPDQKGFSERMKKLKKLPRISHKPFLRTAVLSPGLPLSDVESHVSKLDLAFPDWYSLDPSERCGVNESIDWNESEELSKVGTVSLARFSNFNGFQTTDFSSFLRDGKKGRCLIDQLKWNVRNRSLKGIVVDIEIPLADRNAYTDWIFSLVQSFHDDGLYVAVMLPVENPRFDYASLGAEADFVILKAYDENSSAGLPGPVAGVPWFEESLRSALALVPESKTVVMFGLHSYDWNLNMRTPPERKNFLSAMRLVENSTSTAAWDRASGNGTFHYLAQDGSYHEVWFLDIASVWNQYLSLRGRQPLGISWEWTGEEDPEIWNLPDIGVRAKNYSKTLPISPALRGMREIIWKEEAVSSVSYRLPPSRLPANSPTQQVLLSGIPSFGNFPGIPVVPWFHWTEERASIVGKTLLSQALNGAWYGIISLFLVTTALAVLRVFFLGVFVWRSYRPPSATPFKKRFSKFPPITILVPAYNEEKVIGKTVLGLLTSDYPDFEILVVDDGSADKTAQCVQEIMKTHANVRVITKKNEGKSVALNLGFREAKNEYIVTVDADTVVYPSTVRRLIEPFADSTVDAVCGNIEVGNVKNILTAFQEVEYVTGQNYDRRAFDGLNCITVVPGATGAWKKRKVIEIGGYSGDTLVEDADLTLTLLEKGGKIVYAPEARSLTEAPETVLPLFKQRFRWSYGTLQCTWKHRATLGKGTLGTIALPNMLFFQVVYPVLSPMGDIALLAAVFFGNFEPILGWYVAFFFLDSIVAGVAYVLDNRSIKHMWVILIQRFFYRQFMYVVTYKSVIAAFRGRRHGWNKLERKGTVAVAKEAA
jgi:cellulose synthase/poly-beta-1,6-N-acetylglucosamine synthase-like glycosyltransferase/spore germination protein YaaH